MFETVLKTEIPPHTTRVPIVRHPTMPTPIKIFIFCFSWRFVLNFLSDSKKNYAFDLLPHFPLGFCLKL